MFIYSIRRLNLFVITLIILTLVGYNILLIDPESSWHSYSYWQGWIYYFRQLLEGNLGMSSDGVSVVHSLLHVAPATLELCIFAMLVAVVIGLPLGTLAGIRAGGASDTIISSLALLIFSMPTFWLAILFIMLFSLTLGWFPVAGRYDLLFEIPHVTGFAIVDLWLSDIPQRSQALENIFSHLVMPTLVLAVVPTTEIIKLVRDSVAEVMNQNYIKAAATKGLSKAEIVMRHTIKNAFPPIIPKLGMLVSTMVTFAIITESIFNWPGIGRWLLDALAAEDFVAVQAGVMAVGGFVLLINILSDLFGAAFNPLVRKEWYALK